MPERRSIGQELYDELKRMAASNESFSPVDISLSIGAGEPQVSKALLGLAAEGYLEKVETGKYRAAGMAELGQAEFLKAFARASRVDSTRQRDLAEIARLKQNNDTMRQRLLTAIAERDHYFAALKQRGIDPAPPPFRRRPQGTRRLRRRLSPRLRRPWRRPRPHRPPRRLRHLPRHHPRRPRTPARLLPDRRVWRYRRLRRRRRLRDRRHGRARRKPPPDGSSPQG